jgi:hypothetical protein
MKANIDLFCARFLPSRTIVYLCPWSFDYEGTRGFFSDRFQRTTRFLPRRFELENDLTERQLLPLMRWCGC